MKLHTSWVAGIACLGLGALSGGAEPTAAEKFREMQIRQNDAEAEQAQNWFALVTGDRSASDRILQAIDRSTAIAKVPRTAMPLTVRKLAGGSVRLSQFKGSSVAVLIVHPMDPMLATYVDGLESIRASAAAATNLQPVILVLGGSEEQRAKKLQSIPSNLILGSPVGLMQLVFFTEQQQAYSGTLILIDSKEKVQYQGRVSFSHISALLKRDIDQSNAGATSELAKAQAELADVNRQIERAEGGVPCDKSYYNATAESGNLASWDASQIQRFCSCLESNLIPVLSPAESRAYRQNPASFVKNAFQPMNRVNAGRIFDPISYCQR